MLEDFKVKAGEFEGPLDLLLDLIEKRKLHISDVSLSQVADDFLKYIENQEEFPIADSADFILIASTLLLIKSKSLLPTLDLSEDEKVSIEELENRLEKHKRYKELAAELQKMFGNFMYFPKESRNIQPVFNPTSEITLISVKEAMSRVLFSLPQKAAELPSLSVKKIVSLEEMIGKLSERITSSLRMSFSDFAKTPTQRKEFAGMDRVEKVEVIVSFLAMLELVKRGAVRVAQNNHFDEIHIESENINIPIY